MPKSKFAFLQPAPTTTTRTRKATAAPLAPMRRRAGKSADPAFSALSVYIPRELHRDVKLRLLAEDGGELSELVARLLVDWLTGQKAGRKAR